MTVVSTISTFIYIRAHATIAIEVKESFLTGTGEGTISVGTNSYCYAIMCENIITSTFIDILAHVVTICRFFVTHITVTIIASVVVVACRMIWANCSTIAAFVNIETPTTAISETNTIAVVTVRTSAFKSEVNISTGGQSVARVFSKDTFVFLNAFNAVSFGTCARNLI